MAFELLNKDCAKVELLGTEVCELYVNDKLVFACNTEPPVAPSEIIDLSATDTLVNSIEVTYTPSEGSPTPQHNLYENGGLIAEGIDTGHSVARSGVFTADYHVVALNPSGEITSNVNSGTALAVAPPPAPPGTITNLTATDCYAGYVDITWSPASGANGYNLYKDGSLIGQASSGYRDNGGNISATYYVRAVNNQGSTQSNSDGGKSFASVGSITLSGSGTAVAGTNYPADTTLYIDLQGGGGSGAVSQGGDAGGGFAGISTEHSKTYSCGSSQAYSVGSGGGSISSGSGSKNGTSGSSTTFDNLVGPSGGGGSASGGGYLGYGQGQDGSQNYSGYGGQGIDSGRGGNGGDVAQGIAPTSGGISAGGGGLRYDDVAIYSSGSGGGGRLLISW